VNWGTGSEDGRIAHEFGHILLLPDQYQDINGVSVPNPRFEGDIMATVSGVVSNYDVDVVLSGRACGCKK